MLDSIELVSVRFPCRSGNSSVTCLDPLGMSRDCKRREFARPEFTPARLEKELPRGRSAEVADDAQVWDDLRLDHAGALAAFAELAAPLLARPGN